MDCSLVSELNVGDLWGFDYSEGLETNSVSLFMPVLCSAWAYVMIDLPLNKQA